MSKKSRAYRVRTKEGGGFRTRLVQARSSKKAASGSKLKGRLLSSSKVSMEELLKVGDYFKLGDQLMKEFREEGRRQDHEVKNVLEGVPETKREVFSGKQ